MSRAPSWARVETRLVVGHFVNMMAASHAWRKLYLISPWISRIDHSGISLRWRTFTKRLIDDDCSVYVVTRPPEERWHAEALDSLRATDRASIVTAPNLHTKLFCAETKTGIFALLGSANWTQRSLTNRELGVLVTGSTPEAREVVRLLTLEAADIYRSTPGRTQYCKRKFRR